MAAGRYDFTIEQGSDLNLDISYKDSNGTLLQLGSGYEAAMSIKETVDSAAIVAFTSDANGGITLSNNAPNISIYINFATTANFDFTEAFYDLELTNTTLTPNTKSRLIEGRVELSREITT